MNVILSIVNVFGLAGLAFWLWRKDTGSLHKWYWLVFMLHVFSGLAIGALYFLHYKHGDTLHYFEEAQRINTWARSDFSSYLRFMVANEMNPEWAGQLYYSDARALFMAKLTSISTLFGGENYWVSALHFSFISFTGVWWFSRNFVNFFKGTEYAVVFSFLLFPSVVFWTSGLVKESISMSALYFSVTVFLKLYHREKISIAVWLLLPIAIWLLYMLKYYYLAVLLPVLATTLFHERFIPDTLKKSFGLEALIWFMTFGALTLSATQLHPNFEPDQFLSVLYHNYQDFIHFSQPEDVMIFSFRENWWSIIANSPWAFVSGLFRPFLWESSNFLQSVAAVENLLLIALTVSALPAAGALAHSRHRVLFLCVLVYCFTLGVFLTLSTPNFGTLIRYRVGFIPFFVFLVCVNNPIFKKMTDWLSGYKK